MAFTERSSFRKVVKKNGGWSDTTSEVYYFLSLDRPIYKDQTDRLVADMDSHYKKIMLKPRSKAALILKKWWPHFDSVGHDGYGSFRLEFDEDIWELDDATLEACSEQIYQMFQESDFVNEMLNWISIEEDLEGHIENDDAVEVMNYYIDAVIGCGYRLSQTDVESMFEGYIDSQTVANEFLMRSLAGENVVLKSIKKEENTWAFEKDVA